MSHPFEYAVIRAVPRVERGEQVNVGVLVYCQAKGFLGASTHLDPRRLLALDPEIDLEAVGAVLRSWEHTCEGAPEGVGPARMTPGERFRWLAAPRSTVIQAGPVHTGLTDEPAAELEHLMTRLVR
ncbi:MAG: DUF3037 domain-containing protein [Micromonosporaceae bacterium]